MRTWLFLITFILSLSLSYAQDLNTDWGISLGENSDDFCLGTASDDSNNVYILGSFRGAVDFDPGPGKQFRSSVNFYDFFLLKLNGAGDFIWVRTFGNVSVPHTGSICLKNGVVYIAGNISDSADYDPGPSVSKLHVNGNEGSFVMSLNADDGSFNWAKVLSSNYYMRASSVIVDKNNELYVAGNFRGTVDFDPGNKNYPISSNNPQHWNTYILKLESDATFIWVKTFASDYHNECRKIVASGSHIYIHGTYRDSLDLDPDTSKNAQNIVAEQGGMDHFIVKLTYNGSFVSGYSLGGSRYETAYGIAIDKDMNIYLTGSFSDTSDFHPGAAQYRLISHGGEDVYIQKLDSNLNFKWARSFGSVRNDIAYDIKTDDFGNSYTVGIFNGTVDFDPDTSSYIVQSQNQTTFVEKLDKDGNFSRVKTMKTNYLTIGKNIHLDRSGDFYISGHFLGTIQNDLDSSFSSVGRYDIFVQRFIIGPRDTSYNEVVSCDSFTWINNKTYYQSSFGDHVLYKNARGYDSMVILDLTINSSTESAMQISTCYSFESPSGKLWAASGSYKDTIVNSVGCDSIITVNLTILESTTDTIALTSCDHLISPGGKLWTRSGIYSDTIANSVGCDSFITVNLTILESTRDTIALTNCNVQISPSGKLWTRSGIYSDTIANSVGCDSIITVSLTITEPTADSIAFTSCDNQLSPSGKLWTRSGTYLDTILNTAGCDSLIVVDLTIIESTQSEIEVTSCFEYTSPGGAILTESGIYTDHLINSQGCDSNITIDLTINKVDVGVVQLGEQLVLKANGAVYQWLDCENDYMILEGETRQDLVPEVNGIFAAEVTEFGCVDTTDCYTINTLGLNALSKDRLSVYPNPTPSHLTADLGALEDVHMRVIDLNGHTVYEASNLRVRHQFTLDQPAGLYIVELSSKGYIQYIRITKY